MDESSGDYAESKKCQSQKVAYYMIAFIYYWKDNNIEMQNRLPGVSDGGRAK